MGIYTCCMLDNSYAGWAERIMRRFGSQSRKKQNIAVFISEFFSRAEPLASSQGEQCAASHHSLEAKPPPCICPHIYPYVSSETVWCILDQLH